MDLPIEKIVAEVDPTQFDKKGDSGAPKSETISRIEAALSRMGKNRLLELKLKHLPKDFVFSVDESDESALERALLEKYDV